MRSTELHRSTPELLRWLAERGCPVDISRIESSIKIEQKNGDDATLLFDLPDGRTGCILDLRIINEGPGIRSIRDLEFTLPWPDFGFQLLQDPREGERLYRNLYRFPGPSFEFDRDVVLNHFLLPDSILRPNYPKSGLLLGIGNPMPREILLGVALTGVLRIITDSGTPGTCEMVLLADRMSNSGTNAKRRSSGSKGLFERESGMEDGSVEYGRASDVSLRAPSRAHEPGQHSRPIMATGAARKRSSRTSSYGRNR